MPEEKADATKKKKPQKRSPSFPFVDLRTAVDRVLVLYKHELDNEMHQLIVAQHWGYSEKSSSLLQTLAALRSYGLIDKKAGKWALTDAALDIVMPGSPNRDERIKEAALAPDEFRRLWEQYGPKLPSDENIQFDLTRNRGFNPNSVKDFLQNYKSTISFSSLAKSDAVIDNGDDNEEEKMESQHPKQQSQTGNKPPALQTTVPAIGIPLPRGNFAELRLKERLDEGEFEVLEAILKAMKQGLMKDSQED